MPANETWLCLSIIWTLSQTRPSAPLVTPLYFWALRVVPQAHPALTLIFSTSKRRNWSQTLHCSLSRKGRVPWYCAYLRPTYCNTEGHPGASVNNNKVPKSHSQEYLLKPHLKTICPNFRLNSNLLHPWTPVPRPLEAAKRSRERNSQRKTKEAEGSDIWKGGRH